MSSADLPSFNENCIDQYSICAMINTRVCFVHTPPYSRSLWFISVLIALMSLIKAFSQAETMIFSTTSLHTVNLMTATHLVKAIVQQWHSCTRRPACIDRRQYLISYRNGTTYQARIIPKNIKPYDSDVYISSVLNLLVILIKKKHALVTVNWIHNAGN